MKKANLSFWQMWNLSFGFLGVQFGFALQNGNASRILSDLGADLHSLSLFWLVAPLMGLIVQPVVGAASDKSWTFLGRRGPYILGGAIAAALGMALMPNAGLLTALLPPIIFGAFMLALMDAAFNVTMQPFRALVSDMLPSSQRNQGYSVQALLINIGAVMGSALPFILTNMVGLDNRGGDGVAASVIWSFYIGATILLASVLWTVYKTKEPEPAVFEKPLGSGHLSAERSSQAQGAETKHSVKFKDLLVALAAMPSTMKQLAVVQFFSWFALFIMWVYSTPAIAQYIWGVAPQWFDSAFLASLDGEVPEHILQAKGSAGDWVGILFSAYALFAALFSIVLSRLANKFGRRLIYSASLLVGGLAYLSFLWCDQPQSVSLNLGFSEFVLPIGALYLLLPMLGIGVAWAAILALPYAILADALPSGKTGTYMGIFNFTIAGPQIVSGLVAGQILKYAFNNQAIYIIVLAGVFMCIAAATVFLVKDEASAREGGEFLETV